MIQGRHLWLFCAAIFLCAVVPPDAPEVFAPYPVPSGAFVQDPAFAPDGTLYLTQIDADGKHTIVQTAFRNGTWSAPGVAPFSGRWRDLEEVLSPDGHTMIFASNRPSQGDRAIDGFFGGKARPGRGGNLWETQWNGSVWSEPARLPDALNANSSTFSPALAGDGTLYFMRASGTKLTFHLFVAKLEGGSYRSSTPAPFTDFRYSDFDPAVAPDGSFVVFGSTRPPSPPKGADLFVTFYRNGTWATPVDLGITPNHDAIEPRLDPDGRHMYYNASTPTRLWKIEPCIGCPPKAV